MALRIKFYSMSSWGTGESSFQFHTVITALCSQETSAPFTEFYSLKTSAQGLTQQYIKLYSFCRRVTRFSCPLKKQIICQPFIHQSGWQSMWGKEWPIGNGHYDCLQPIVFAIKNLEMELKEEAECAYVCVERRAEQEGKVAPPLLMDKGLHMCTCMGSHGPHTTRTLTHGHAPTPPHTPPPPPPPQLWEDQILVQTLHRHDQADVLQDRRTAGGEFICGLC